PFNPTQSSVSQKAMRIGLAVAGVLIALYFYLTYSGERSWQGRVERSSQFFYICAQIASYIRTSPIIPQSIEELRSRTGLSLGQWEFFRSNNVIYVPPRVLTNGEVILRMPYDHGLDLMITLDGSMRKGAN